jgi:hypothetical protein
VAEKASLNCEINEGSGMVKKHAVMAYFYFYLWNNWIQKLLGVINCLRNKREAQKRIAPHQILPPEPENNKILMDLVSIMTACRTVCFYSY